MMPPRTCLFCNGTPVTREHAWPQWYLRFLGNEHPGKYLYVSRGPVGDMQTFISDQALISRRFCHDCNTQWMSRKENKTKNLVLHLALTRRQVSLPRRDQAKLASWAYLRILAFDPVHRGIQPPIPKEAYEEFYKTRRAPLNVGIWTCAFSCMTYVGLSRRNVVDYTEPTGTRRFFLSTFTLGRLALQVLGPLDFGGDLPRIQVDKFFNTSQIWPLSKARRSSILWPRNRKALEMEDLEHFANREIQ